MWNLLSQEAVKANSSGRFKKGLDNAFDNMSRAAARGNRQGCAFPIQKLGGMLLPLLNTPCQD